MHIDIHSAVCYERSARFAAGVHELAVCQCSGGASDNVQAARSSGLFSAAIRAASVRATASGDAGV